MLSRIQHFPVSCFAIVMGLGGFTIALQRAEMFLGFTWSISSWFLGLTVVMFILLSLVMTFKAILFFNELKQDLANPIKLNFVPTFSIGFLLLSIAFLAVNLEVSRYLWVVGAILHLVFTFWIMSFWIQRQDLEIKQINPAWFIPVVGNIIVPVAGVVHFDPELSWFFFSVGLIFWLILFTIIFYRIIFYHPIPQKLLPTLFILIAPPAIGMVAYIRLVGELDNLAKVLYYFGLFITMLVLLQLKSFLQLKFFMSWWAYSFPLAAITIATEVMFHYTGLEFYRILAYVLLGLLASVIFLLIGRTTLAVKRREICVPEG